MRTQDLRPPATRLIGVMCVLLLQIRFVCTFSFYFPATDDLTVACYPLNDRDPFLIEETPDVYFVGNQDHFATRIYNGPDGHRIRVVLLPRFSTSGQVVLVNPTTLECKVVEIGPAKFAI